MGVPTANNNDVRTMNGSSPPLMYDSQLSEGEALWMSKRYGILAMLSGHRLFRIATITSVSVTQGAKAGTERLPPIS
jgi:hypothetical protein